VPLHAQKCYEYLGNKDKDFPVACRSAREVVSIPIFPDLTEDERNYVVETITGFFK